ncbi:uncharacterized protein LDX57_001042 [Aspergillus melleus]|uniref:uncharacterized protein n=1 Tax=Aspergillus melleus TaxID=138277 RepID=UPI001E8DCF99|nr:uncharacterized protein LDX57_001042 [Aspergillus melleus]KAH8423284.1 hypothetical protein LDX57_001042 [Aspergillus melleus]
MSSIFLLFSPLLPVLLHFVLPPSPLPLSPPGSTQKNTSSRCLSFLKLETSPGTSGCTEINPEHIIVLNGVSCPTLSEFPRGCSDQLRRKRVIVMDAIMTYDVRSRNPIS